MNLSKKLLLTLSFTILIIPNSFALDKANLTVENNKIDINDYVKLHISIETSTGGSIGIDKINGIDGSFDVVGQSQSQSSSSQISTINGKTENKTITQYEVILDLKAKKKGSYEIGPASINGGNQKIETNSVKVEVTGDQLFLNNNHLQIPQNNNNPKIPQNSLNKEQKDDEIIDFGKNMKKRNFDDDESLYILIIVLLIIGAGLYFIIKKDRKVYLVTKSKENLENSPSNIKDKKVEFEENKETLVYPEIKDINFIQKLENIFKIKISNKYKIYIKGDQYYKEIIENINDIEERISLEKVIDLINKAKYSNINYDKESLVNLIKNI